jgi:hypothetical protein
MNTTSIRRMFATVALTAAALSGMAASAQPALPAALPQPIGIISPADGVLINYSHDFAWQNTGANQFVLKFTVNETGQTVKMKFASETCGLDTCSFDFYDTPLFDVIKDGQSATWRVIGKYDSGKSKTTPRTIVANTVETPLLMSPANGANLGGDAPLVWKDGAINLLYTVVVKNNATGEKMLKTTIHTDSCPADCLILPHVAAELTAGATYKWFVKSQGYNGNKLKSPVRTFIVPLAEQVR